MAFFCQIVKKKRRKRTTFRYFSYLCIRNLLQSKRMDTNIILTVALISAIIVMAQLLRCQIQRTGVSVALICIMTTAMAQTNPAISWRYSDRFPKLPSLKVDFNTAMFTHDKPNFLMTPHDTIDMDKETNQSIMVRHKNRNNETMPHFNFKLSNNYQGSGDALKGVRDRIVRKRRINEGHPLPPPTPVMRR